MDSFIDDILKDLEEKGLKRSLRSVEGFQQARLNIEGRVVLNFCSNNYLGLASDSRLGQAALDCIKEEGFGAGASRLICGNMSAHRKLEEKIAEFKNTEAALVFSTGYMANVGIISSLFDKNDIIFTDKLNHASIIDGIMLSGAKFKRYPHCDMAALNVMLQKAQDFQKRVIITDTVFSMDGDIAPLDKIVELAEKYKCMVMVDEAHALGVMGKKGRGCTEHFGVSNKIDIQMGTLSKAAGSFGAYCCGSKKLIDFLINKARSFIYTTAMPPVVAAVSAKAIEIIESSDTLREKLWENARYMRAQLNLIGFDTMNTQTPIIPIMIKDNNLAAQFSKRLYDYGVFVSAIRPPTVPPNTARLRLTVMATHDKVELDFTINQIEKIGKELCLI